MKVLYEKSTGKPREYEAVDAREILKNSPDLYTDANPNPPDDPDGDGFKGAPVNEGTVQDEFRREPVGDDPPEATREQVIIRNPVTDRPRMADPAAGEQAEDADFDAMTVAELKDYAHSHDIDTGDATLKADILKKVKKGAKA